MATVRMPNMRHARRMRIAISPRLAIRTFLNMALLPGRSGGFDLEELLPELDRLAVLGEHFDDGAGAVRFELVHQLHRFDDAERLALADLAADIDERGRVRR